MTVTELRTQDLPAPERFGYWHDLTAGALIPTVITCDEWDDFRATLRSVDLGPVQVSAMTYPSLAVRRTPRLISRRDPEMYQLAVTLQGRQALDQAGRSTVAGSGELLLYDSSRTFSGEVAAGPGGRVETVIAQFPRALLPLPDGQVAQLLATRLPGEGMIASFLVHFLTRLTSDTANTAADTGDTGDTGDTAELHESDAPRLATVLLDLVTAVLAHELDAAPLTPPETRRRTLLLRVQEYVRHHLHEPDLTPAALATAHHISIRQLHRLFEDEGCTAAAWIRTQRLDRCRRDLADPAQRHVPVHAVAARWGFGHPAAFSRAFRAAYGMPPRDYREQFPASGTPGS